MDYPFTVSGYENVPLILRSNGFSAVQILYGGAPLEKISPLNFRLTFSDGSNLDLKIKPGGLTFTPQVLHGAELIKPVPPLPAYSFVLIYAPLALIGFGGALGGVCGGAAAAINAAIFRSDLHVAAKIGLALLTAFGAGMLWLVLALLINSALHH